LFVRKLLAVFIIIPVLEMFILIKIGQMLGVWPTLAFVVGLGALGFILVKTQGLYVLNRVQYEINSGKVPGDTLLDGVLVLAGGILLITPGVLTAGIGLLLMFPAIRYTLRQMLKDRLAHRLRSGRWHFQYKGW
jgi:UPF0716 protein FxsA